MSETKETTLRRALIRAKAALESDRQSHPFALGELIKAVEALHPEGKPTGIVYVLLNDGVDPRMVHVTNSAPRWVSDSVECWEATINGDGALRVEP